MMYALVSQLPSPDPTGWEMIKKFSDNLTLVGGLCAVVWFLLKAWEKERVGREQATLALIDAQKEGAAKIAEKQEESNKALLANNERIIQFLTDNQARLLASQEKNTSVMEAGNILMEELKEVVRENSEALTRGAMALEKKP